jgi:hypothetical protein
MSKTEIARQKEISRFEEIFRGHVVGIDVDQILLSSIHPVIKQVSVDFDGLEFPLSSFKGWNSIRDFLLAAGKNPKEAEEYEDWVWRDSEIIKNAPPIVEAQAFTKTLTYFGIEYYAITSRAPRLSDATYHSFSKYFDWIREDQICQNEDENLEGDDYKWMKVKEKKVTLHLDDAPHQMELILKNTPAFGVLISNYPESHAFKHERVLKVNHTQRFPTLGDFCKKVYKNPNLIPSHNIDSL